VYVRFPVVDADFDLLVWTTTPWTLVSNVAAAVGPDIDYVRVRVPEGRDLVLAASRVAAVLGDDAEVVGPVAAADLIGRHYERPFDLLPIESSASRRPATDPEDRAGYPGPEGADPFRIVGADFVTVEDGSGIVHLAPAFGEIDREVGEREGLPILNPVGPDARFDSSVPGLAGTFVKDADPALIDALAESGRLVAAVDYTHSYPHCWRCGTPLIYWAKPTWFARTSDRKDALLRENETIGWHPEHIKHGRFGDWLENNVDWALSRDRYWGTPLPVWRCTDCRTDTCVGSVEQLTLLAGQDLTELDLHRPYVDDVTIACPSCGARARRVEPVLDAWFDSGSMPSAQFHFPFENQDLFERRFPADFISEAIDQTRGWFYSLLAVNTLVFDRSPYRNVVCLELIVDKDGQKMSKSRGNVIDPWEILDSRGADALRWWFFSAGSPWTPRRVNIESIDESTSRFLVTLWNTYSFFVTYANIDGWTVDRAQPATHVLDRWVRSRMHGTIREVTSALDAFDSLRAAQALDGLVDDLSNWYVRRSRPRFWKDTDAAAHTTLHECIVVVAKLLAPLCPFVSDELYRNLVPGAESVHFEDWPEIDEGAIDLALEAQMERTRRVVSLGLAARSEHQLKVRVPLRRALVLLPEGGGLDDAAVEEVEDALNVKAVEIVTDLEGLLDYEVAPNFRTLGPRIGKLAPQVKAALTTADHGAIRRAIENAGHYELTLESGETVTLTPEDVEVRATSHDQFALARDGGYAVALDTALDEELRLEGLARELARRLNDLRKASGLEIADRIRVDLWADGTLRDAADRHREWIKGEVLAKEFDLADTPGSDSEHTEVEIDGFPARVRLEKI
jgi:isoleucyl-tRNA synthetase